MTEIVELIKNKLPCDYLISHWEFDDERKTAQFSWMGNRFEVSENNLSVTTLYGNTSCGLLLETLLKCK